jgi:hypothetical protein
MLLSRSVLELAVAAGRTDMIPAVIGQQFEDVSDLQFGAL